MGQTEGDARKWQPSKQKRGEESDGGAFELQEHGPSQKRGHHWPQDVSSYQHPTPSFPGVLCLNTPPARVSILHKKKLKNNITGKKTKKPQQKHVIMCACVKVSFGLIEGDQCCVLLRGRSAEDTQGLLSFSFRMYLGESSEQAECLNQCFNFFSKKRYSAITEEQDCSNGITVV